MADAATIETLVEELSNPDESAVLYAIEMLEALDKRNLVTPLLLQHDSPRVRRADVACDRAFTFACRPARWMTTVERMVQDEDVDVRAAALRALAELAHEDAAVVDAPASCRRGTARRRDRGDRPGQSGEPEDVDAAEAAFSD